MYSVISVIVDSLPENTKNRESTRSWCDWTILGRIELIQGSPKTRIPSGRGNLAFGSIRISIGNSIAKSESTVVADVEAAPGMKPPILCTRHPFCSDFLPKTRPLSW